MSTDRRHLSLWWDTLPAELAVPSPDHPRTALHADADADVVIVGAGFTGLWTAYWLLQHDATLRVRVLDAQVAGFGASGRNGGWCSALFPSSMAAVARASSRDAAIRLQRELDATVDHVGAVLQEEGIDAHFAKGGTVVGARTSVQWERAQEEVAEARRFDRDADDLTLLDAAATARMVGMTELLGGTFTPHCAALHPARLVRGLAQAVERAGAVIHERSPVIRIAPGRVHTRDYQVRAPIVVRATEGYTAGLDGHRRDLAPIYSLMIATEPLPDDVWDRIGLSHRQTFADHRHLIIYGQRTADGRIAFGGRGAPYHFGSQIRPEFDRSPAVFDELIRTLHELFPAVRDARITHRWGGPLGVPRDWFASVGLDRSSGLAHAGGYVGDGVGASHLAGRTLADLILERATDRTTLPWVNHQSPRWEPEPLRWIGANTGLSVMRSADNVEDRTGRPSRRSKVFGRLLGH
jgi:glycine/D-amino acid oxidase-like deaminating enzyme